MARPMRPPSPSVLFTLGILPTEPFWPVLGLRRITCCASRWQYRMLPSGRVTRPQGTSLSVPTCWVPQIGLPHDCPVVTLSLLLGADTLACASRATTWYE